MYLAWAHKKQPIGFDGVFLKVDNAMSGSAENPNNFIKFNNVGTWVLDIGVIGCEVMDVEYNGGC